MIIMIVAMDEKRIIGFNHSIPWQNKEDLLHFKTTTSGHSVVMGRKTYESLKKPLANRINYVLTTGRNYQAATGVIIINEIQKLLSVFQNSADILFVIGGAEVYQLFMPYCHQIIVSLIPGEHQGDTYFPEFESQFQLRKVENMSSFELRHYERGR